MTVITAKELADMRAIADDFFPDTCTIQTPTQSLDALNAPTETFASTYTNVVCRVDPVNPVKDDVGAYVKEGEATSILNIPYD